MAQEAGREGKRTESRNLKTVKKNNETSSPRTSKNMLVPCFLKKISAKHAW